MSEKKITSKKTLKNFRKELKELFIKYDASIDFTASDSSDFYGINGEALRFTITEEKDNKKARSNFEIAGYGVDKNDL